MFTSIEAPSRVEALSIIRKLNKKGAISWTKHCEERMIERGITTTQIFRCLEKGTIKEDPYFDHSDDGGYMVTMEKGTAGDWLRVVLCIKFTESLLIITAIK